MKQLKYDQVRITQNEPRFAKEPNSKTTLFSYMTYHHNINTGKKKKSLHYRSFKFLVIIIELKIESIHSDSVEAEGEERLSISRRSRAFWWAQVSMVRSGLALSPTPRMTMVRKLVM